MYCVSKFNVGLQPLLHLGISAPEFYVDFKKIMGRTDFSDQFRNVILHYTHIGYNLNVMQQSACLVFTQTRLITLLHPLIARQWVGRKLYDGSDLKLVILVGWDGNLLHGPPWLN